MEDLAPDDQQRLADAIRQRIYDLGMSQADLVRASGISDTTIRDIQMRRKHRLRPTTFRQLDEGLRWPPGTTLAVTRGNQTPPTTIRPTPAGLDQRIADLTPDEQARVDAFIDGLLANRDA